MGVPPVYLDNLATTPVDPEVLEAMLPYFAEDFGNAASKTHAWGLAAAVAVERARGQVAALIGAAPGEIVFTSGATESNNLALVGVAERAGGGHIVTCATEHKAVLDTCRYLEGRGCEITCLGVDSRGRIDIEELRAALRADTILISIMAANNEIGTVQPLAAIGALAREEGVLWHCDAAQAAGKIPLDVEALGVGLMSISGHKIYGPKGVGALYARARRPRVRLRPQMHGGGQEQGRRAGTLNVPGIVGLGQACALCRRHLEMESRRLLCLRRRLGAGIAAQLEGVELNGHPEERVPGNLHLSFAGVDGAALLLSLREIALSSAAACTAGAGEPSHVLKAIGLDHTRAQASLRFGLGRFNTAEEVEYTIGRVVEEVRRLRCEGEAALAACGPAHTG